mmetsp:Transcript_105647/g.187859  ORF Transcript_105647/g.187859 Transcript_105647/m.187859 type:complete len:232 (-) Transcript_105647:79-774(-)
MGLLAALAIGTSCLASTTASEATCHGAGAAMSLEEVEECESLSMAQEEVSLLQRDVQMHGSDKSALPLGFAWLENISDQSAIPLSLEEEAMKRRSDIKSYDLGGQLQYELEVGAGTEPVSKVALVLLELTGLSICGLDRCYMGQCGLGLLKGLTLGGLSVWFIFDYLSVIITSLSGSHYMNAFGMKGHFLEGEMAFAFWLTLILLIVKCFAGTYKSVQFLAKPMYTEPPKA